MNEQVLISNVSANAVEKQIEETQSKKVFSNNVFDEKNYLDLKLRHGETQRTVKIRILPVSATDSSFCFTIKTHSLKLSKSIATSGFKSFICLNDTKTPNYDSSVKCPICQKSNELFEAAKKAREDGNEELSKTLFKEACQFKNKDTYIVRVIERGKENEGVKFWRFNANSKGEGYYDKLIALYQLRKQEHAEAGICDDFNIFDLNNGRDINLTLTRTLNSRGDESVAIQVADASISSPLSKDISLANKWINDKKVWSDAYSVKNAEYLSIIVDGKIPVFDKDRKCYIALSEKDLNDKKAEVEPASEVLAEQKNVSIVEEDLPF